MKRAKLSPTSVYELLHKIPHIKVTSKEEIERAFENGKLPQAIYFASGSSRISRDFIDFIARFGVFVLKLPRETYNKFALLLRQKGYPIQILGKNLIQNPIEIPTQYGVVYVVKSQGRSLSYKAYERDGIIEMAKQGKTINEIRKFYPHISYEVIRRIIKEAGIRMKRGRPRISMEVRKKVIALYRQGYSYSKIAEELGIAKGTVFNIIKEMVYN